MPIATGDKVIARIQSHSEDGSEAPDAIILDLHLVKYTGAQLLKRIRSYASMEHIFIVVLTASNAPGERKQAEEFGANAHFRKSLDLDEFMSVGHDIAAILKQRLRLS
jgi:CheY-like chemotaxis protein